MATPARAPVSLESGDHLTRDELHRRYLARPDITRAELVEGVVYVGGRVKAREHGQPRALVVGWLGQYAANRPPAECLDSVTVILDDCNEVQPDAILWRPGGSNARETGDGYLEGAPDLIVDVAASSASYDLHVKREAYRRNDVPEYVVWRTLDRGVDWFGLRDGRYVRVEPDADGIIESEQFPGLRLHVPSLLARDRPGLVAAVRDVPNPP